MSESQPLASTSDSNDSKPSSLESLKQRIERWAGELGFTGIGVSDTELGPAQAYLKDWLARRMHGEMHYMQRHADLRGEPALLAPGTVRVISVRLDYLPEPQQTAKALLDHPTRAYVSRYALGRDYHKLMRKRLARLAARIQAECGDFNGRAFVDSAPLMEKPLAEKAGLGWIGKHTNLIHQQHGSWFFLGELLTNLALPVDAPASGHCGSCRACIDVCPTGAIVAPYELDARRCISYLTIEHDGDIPEPLRKPIGNRIYGCDDCQLFCPWNKFARQTAEPDFAPRHALDDSTLSALAEWHEAQWLEAMAGSAIRRIGFRRWQRNLAVALGNAADSDDNRRAIARLQKASSRQVRDHADWAQTQLNHQARESE